MHTTTLHVAWFSESDIKIMQHEAMLHGLSKVKIECQLYSHGQALTSMIAIVKHGRKNKLVFL